MKGATLRLLVENASTYPRQSFARLASWRGVIFTAATSITMSIEPGIVDGALAPLKTTLPESPLSPTLRQPSVKAYMCQHKGITQRMKMGGFNNVEDALQQVLEKSPVLLADSRTASNNRTGADLIAAMQSSPYRGIEIEPGRYRMPVRDVAF